MTKKGYTRAQASLTILESAFQSPQESPVSPANSFATALRMISPTPSDRYQSTAARNDCEKSVFASEPCQNNAPRKTFIAATNKKRGKDRRRGWVWQKALTSCRDGHCINGAINKDPILAEGTHILWRFPLH